MKFIFSIAFSLFISHSFCQNESRLFLFSENNKYGYINSKGDIIIPAQFYSAGNFSEGLAPVRLKGTYGYIDTKGDFVIPSKYDFAELFINETAKIYLNGKPYFIDKKGTITFEHNYKEIYKLGNHNYLEVLTITGKQGVVDKSGRIIIDSIFQYVGSFGDGVAVVSSFGESRLYDYEQGVIDTLGNWIVEFGKYDFIQYFVNGYSKVSMVDSNDKLREGVIDTHGNLLFIAPEKEWYFGDDGASFSEDVLSVNVYASAPEQNFAGVINNKGEILFSNQDWVYITPYKQNKAFAQDSKKQWHLIDKEGKIISRQNFSEIEEIEHSWHRSIGDYYAFGKVEDKWGSIDTLGNFKAFINGDKFHSIQYLVDNIVRVSIHSEEQFLDGFIDLSANYFVVPQFSGVVLPNLSHPFDNELIYIDLEKEFGYVNRKGEFIWKGKKVFLEELNIDFMMPSYYHVSSSKNDNYSNRKLWTDNNNLSKSISKKKNSRTGQIQLMIDTTQLSKWEGFDGYKLYVTNSTSDIISLACQDGRLYLKIQALDKNGKWNDIEYIYNSRCGHSYYYKSLMPNEYWEFDTPVYQGEFKTKLRAELSHIKVSKKSKKLITVYSNEIDGHINPAQFWSAKSERSPLNVIERF